MSLEVGHFDLSASTDGSLLVVSGLRKAFGGVRAVWDVDFEVGKGSVVGLIGPNGAGKTTALNLIAGAMNPDEGKVVFDCTDITGWPSHAVAARGLVRTFQHARAFRSLSVLENVKVGLHCELACGWAAMLSASRRTRRADKEADSRARACLELVRLRDRADELAGNLPYGHIKLLDLARALAPKPRLVLLDEPLAGLNTTEIQETLGVLSDLRKEGLAMVVIEHNMRAIMRLSDKIVVLNRGLKIFEGAPPAARTDPEVIEAYLGKEFDQ